MTEQEYLTSKLWPDHDVQGRPQPDPGLMRYRDFKDCWKVIAEQARAKGPRVLPRHRSLIADIPTQRLRKFRPPFEIDPADDIQSQSLVPGSASIRVPFIFWHPLEISERERLGIESGIQHEDVGEVPKLNSAQLVRRLRDRSLSHDERQRLVVDAEAITFTESEAGDLAAILREFVLAYRHSDNALDLISVGSAIRKYIAVMPSDDIASIAVLLERPSILSAPPDVEVELTKMVVRKLTANPPTQSDAEPELAARLNEVANAYLNDRILPRDKFGAIALNVVTAIALLDSRHLPMIIEKLNGLEAGWFKELLQRNSQRLRAQLSSSGRAQKAGPSIKGLKRLIDRLSKPRRTNRRNASRAAKR